MNRPQKRFYLNQAELEILDKMHPVNVSIYLCLKRHLENKYDYPAGIEFRQILLSVIRRGNPHSVYNVAHRFRKSGLAKTEFRGRKGIFIDLVHADRKPKNTKIRRPRTISIRPGEHVFVCCEGN